MAARRASRKPSGWHLRSKRAPLFLHVLDDHPMLQQVTSQASIDEMLKSLRHFGLDVPGDARQAAEKAALHCEVLLPHVGQASGGQHHHDQTNEHHCT